MANNLLVLAVVSLAVFAIAADGYAYKTVVTTMIYGGSENDGCKEEIERQDLGGCERYLSEGNQRDIDRCCQQLEQMDERCKPEALQKVMQSQKGQSEGQEMMERMREVRETCRVGVNGRKIRMMH